MAHKFGFHTWVSEEERDLEHLLHLLWSLEEEGDTQLATLRERWEHDGQLDRVMDGAVEQELVVPANGGFHLSGEGRPRTEEIVRRHRLAECLLSEVLLLEEEDYQQNACEFEHILGPEVTDSICALLGHPPVCPHGRPIPRGACCSRYRDEVKPLVVRLADLTPGDVGKVVFVSAERGRRLDRLSAMGLMPGTLVKLHQRQPSFILDLGETQLAVDREIAAEIFVKKMGCSFLK